MANLTTRELLYLEDMSKMFESFSKVCDSAAGSTQDQQLKSMLQAMSQEHRQWISSTASIVTNNNIQ
jgi:hypothetical protein